MDELKSYYDFRKEFNYYKKIVEILNDIGDVSSIIDIGGRKSPVLEKLDKSIYKASLDIITISPSLKDQGVVYINADFLTWIPDKNYDVVLCLQVLEHLDNPKEFALKLFSTGKIVIISLPYKWREGFCASHVQDPVDELKIKEWTQREPSSSFIVKDLKANRIICVYL
jgi:hypothetical protein